MSFQNHDESADPLLGAKLDQEKIDELLANDLNQEEQRLDLENQRQYYGATTAIFTSKPIVYSYGAWRDPDEYDTDYSDTRCEDDLMCNFGWFWWSFLSFMFLFFVILLFTGIAFAMQ